MIRYLEMEYKVGDKVKIRDRSFTFTNNSELQRKFDGKVALIIIKKEIKDGIERYYLDGIGDFSFREKGLLPYKIYLKRYKDICSDIANRFEILDL